MRFAVLDVSQLYIVYIAKVVGRDGDLIGALPQARALSKWASS